MGEIWDIYDINKQLTGRTMKRNDWNMKDGDYHLTVLGIIKHGHQGTGKSQAVHARLERHLFRLSAVRFWKKPVLMYHMLMAALNFLTEEIILKKMIIILLIYISLTWTLQKQIYIYRQRRLPVSDLLQQKKSKLSLTEENFFITTA